MDFQQAADYTNSYRSTRRATDGFRAAFSTQYALGQVLKLASQDLQVYTDGATVVPTAAVASDTLMVGVVSEDWTGFDGAGATLAPGTTARGTSTIKATVYGYHPSVLVDQSSGAAAITNGVRLTSSAATAGKAMGLAAPTEQSGLGFAVLPASGIGSSLGAGALVAATQTLTVGGTPATGDGLQATLQIPYGGTLSNPVNPGVAQTRTITATLTAAQAASTTTAAVALAAAINADGVLSTYYSATSSAAVVTVTVKAAQFLVTFAGSGSGVGGGGFYITTAGTVGNSLTIAGGVTAGSGSTVTAGGSTFASGAGYIGTVPAFIVRL